MIGSKKKAATRSGPTRSISCSRATSESCCTWVVFGISGPKAARLPSIPPRLVPKPNTPWKLPLRLITWVRCGWSWAAQ